MERGVVSVTHREDGKGRIQCSIQGMQRNVVIHKEHMNRAMHRDIVVVEVRKNTNKDNTEERDTEEEGRVVGIERRGRHTHACTVDRAIDAMHIVLKPIFVTIPCMIVRASVEHTKGKIVLAWISGWDTGAQYPTGHIVRVIGNEGSIEAETNALLAEHRIVDKAFEQEAKEELPDSTWDITEDDIQARTDMRTLPIASIDPEGCVDIDDALHARVLPNGNTEIGVHIADVTHFVQEHSMLDREGRIRGCTVYLPNRRIDMLPPILGTDICSLHKNKTRLAFSVIWEIQTQDNAHTHVPDIVIVNTKVTKSIIRSRESFTYDRASSILAGSGTHKDTQLVDSLHRLKRISSALKQKRLQQGAFVIYSSECRVVCRDAHTKTLQALEACPEKHIVTEAQHEEEHDTHSLVEEYMLLANHTVAEIITKAYKKEALVRIHPAPVAESFRALEHALRIYAPDQHIELDPAKPAQLSHALSMLSHTEEMRSTIGAWAAQCMTQAVYTVSSADARHHYGLAIDDYTHFTSPIRRYADIVVHRLLYSAMSTMRVSPLTQYEIEEICETANRTHRRSKIVAREANRMYIRHLIADKTVRLCITSIEHSSVTVHCPAYSVNGILRIQDRYKIQDEKIVCKEETKKEYKLMSFIYGRVCKDEKRELVFAIAE